MRIDSNSCSYNNLLFLSRVNTGSYIVTVGCIRQFWFLQLYSSRRILIGRSSGTRSVSMGLIINNVATELVGNLTDCCALWSPTSASFNVMQHRRRSTTEYCWSMLYLRVSITIIFIWHTPLAKQVTPWRHPRTSSHGYRYTTERRHTYDATASATGHAPCRCIRVA